MNFTTNNEEETKKIAQDIAKHASPGDIFFLTGELGAGKTTFSKGFLSHFGVEEDGVISPTFTLMQIYENKSKRKSDVKKIVHIDTYRMEDPNEFLEIGSLDYVGKTDTVSLIEWPEKIKGLIDKPVKSIEISTISPSERSIQFSSISTVPDAV